MNKNFFEFYKKNAPENSHQKYIFLVDNQNFSLNLLNACYNSLYLSTQDDTAFFTVESFISILDSLAPTTHLSEYHYVIACFSQETNSKLQLYLSSTKLTYSSGKSLLENPDMLTDINATAKFNNLLNNFITNQLSVTLDLKCFHIFNSEGKITGIKDLEIVDYIMNHIRFFVLGATPYYYSAGVYTEDINGVYLKHHIQNLIYHDFTKFSLIKRVYNLLITQPEVQKTADELNLQPTHWVNFANGYYDPIAEKMHSHTPNYYTTNQIPYSFLPDNRDTNLKQGKNIKKYLSTSLPDPIDQQTYWEYFGYCMTIDTRFQKFLILKGNGGTGKSVAIDLIQYIIGNKNISSISLQDLNKRFFATGLYGKLLNACADNPCKALETSDVLKKAVGEDSLLYERKGQDAVPFRSYAKLLFSVNHIPQNLDDETNAFSRRLLILDMNHIIPKSQKDLHLKEKMKTESTYAIQKAMDALKDLYDRGEFAESSHSKDCILELKRGSDSISAFITQMISHSPNNNIKRSTLFTAYEDYCKTHKCQPFGKKEFFYRLSESGFTLKKIHGEYFYINISIF